ncbi:MAG: type II secretion system protein [Sporichthyaceae bacterium]
MIEHVFVPADAVEAPAGKNIVRRLSDKGFTLIELLVVITILGIMSAITVFALGGLDKKSQVEACKADTQVLELALAAAMVAEPGKKFITEAELVSKNYIKEASSLHDIVLTKAGTNALLFRNPSNYANPAAPGAKPSDNTFYAIVTVNADLGTTANSDQPFPCDALADPNVSNKYLSAIVAIGGTAIGAANGPTPFPVTPAAY